MAAYYNEMDPFAAAWLRELMKVRHGSGGLIADGEVDERSIVEVQPEDVRGFTQCHFFAGIGCWSYALRRAGWADDTRAWTGSCPCQSFSASGKRGGFSDPRHLWPAWFRLIGECGPDICFGEQVASKDGLAWLDVVSADLESAGYAVGTTDLCAAGVGAPHIRQRLYFVAESEKATWRHQRIGRELGGAQSSQGRGRHKPTFPVNKSSEAGGMADAEPAERRAEHGEHGQPHGRNGLGRGSVPGELGDADIAGPQGQPELAGAGGSECAAGPAGVADRAVGESERVRRGGRRELDGSEPQSGGDEASERGQHWDAIATPNFTNGFWAGAEWLPCRDGKMRPVEPGTFPLAHGAAARVGRLRGYGNALCAPAAEEFIRAYLAIRD